MVTRYLLDTNVWIVYLKNHQSTIRGRLERASRDEITTCSVVWAELLHGARKYDDPAARQAKVEKCLGQFQSFDFDLDAARRYAKSRDFLERNGCLIGLNDLMIAAIALANDLTVVTNNTGEFARIPGLRIEDWSV